MCFLSRNECQEYGDFINQYTTHMTVQQADKVVIKALNLNHLVDQEDDNMTCLNFGMSYSGIDYDSMIQSCFGIASKDIHWSIVIMYY